MWATLQFAADSGQPPVSTIGCPRFRNSEIVHSSSQCTRGTAFGDLVEAGLVDRGVKVPKEPRGAVTVAVVVSGRSLLGSSILGPFIRVL